MKSPLSLKLKFGIVILLLAAMSAMACITPFGRLRDNGSAYAAEAPSASYNGDTAAASVLAGIRYTDIAVNAWSKEAIYEVGALGIVKGLAGTPGRFGGSSAMTKEEAIATAYRAAGREGEARQLGVVLNNSRTGTNKKTDPLAVLYDGFLQLAANDGLITAQNLADALNPDQTALTAESFRRSAPAQRQEMAYWLAMTLGIGPAGQLRDLLNYSDWRSVDPDKMQYMEAILQEGIMTGSGSRLNPRQSVTREQAAQVLKNADTHMLEALKLTKNFGTIENISATKDYTGNIAVSGKYITVRGSDGKLVSISTSVPQQTTVGGKNENAGTAISIPKRELVVYKNGAMGDSSLLKAGDRLEYITDSSGTVKYIHVISNVNDVRYTAAQINSVDKANLLLNVTQLFALDYPDIKSITGNISFSGAGDANALYRVSAGAEITVNGAKSTIAGVTEDATAILTIGGNNIVKAIQCVDFGINSESKNIVRGIVEENNPALGYITIYNEDGSGAGSSKAAALRTYNYANLNKTEIYRNHKAAKADDVQTGDTAYIRLDNEGDVASISSVDNYTVKYARVISKMTASIAVKYDDGSEQVLDAGNDVIVIMDKRIVGLKELKDGDRVRLLLNDGNKTTELKEITIEGDEHFISNIYKGTIARIDEMSRKITVMGLEAFNRGKWERTDRKGVTVIPLAEGFDIYSGGTAIGIEDANRLFGSNEAYIAVERTYGGGEEAVLLSYRNSSDTPFTVSADTIANAVPGSGMFALLKDNRKVTYSKGSIVVKYGRLVSGSSLSDNDEACLAIDRDYSTGAYKAAVIRVDEPKATGTPTVYRGRISVINENSSFTLESFSRLEGTDWQYANTPKTFSITSGTRILDGNGVFNVRDFKGYGADSYAGRVVYVAADGTNAALISTAPYGTVNIKGTVYANDGKKLDLHGVRIYDAAARLWTDGADMSAGLLNNSIVIKDGRIAGVADIRKGDAVRIIKKDAAAGGDAYIIFAE